MGLCGMSNAIVQALLGGRVIRYFGPKRVFSAAFCAVMVAVVAFPLMSTLARRAGRVDAAVIAVLVCGLACNFVLYFAFGNFPFWCESLVGC